MNKIVDNGHNKDLVNVMCAHDLFAVDSMFKPKRSSMFQKQSKRVCSATWTQNPSTAKTHPRTFAFRQKVSQIRALGLTIFFIIPGKIKLHCRGCIDSFHCFPYTFVHDFFGHVMTMSDVQITTPSKSPECGGQFVSGINRFDSVNVAREDLSFYSWRPEKLVVLGTFSQQKIKFLI